MLEGHWHVVIGANLIPNFHCNKGISTILLRIFFRLINRIIIFLLILIFLFLVVSSKMHDLGIVLKIFLGISSRLMSLSKNIWICIFISYFLSSSIFHEPPKPHLWIQKIFSPPSLRVKEACNNHIIINIIYFHKKFIS